MFVCLPVIAATSTLFWYGPRFRNLANSLGGDIYSPYEVIGLAYNSRVLGSIIFLLTAIFVVPLISMQIVGFGRLLEGMFAFDYYLSIFSLILVFIIYTIFAGMEGDVKTDLFQASAMLIGLLFLAGYALYVFFNGDFSAHIIDINKHLTVPGPEGYFTTSTLVSIALIMAGLPLVNGHYLMRFMIAKDNKALRKGVQTASLVIFAFYALAAIIGICGLVIEPSLDSGDKLTGVLLDQASTNFIGALIAGTILFAIISASLSSVDSQFLALGAGATRDIFKNLLKFELTRPQQMATARAVMFFIGLAAILMAMDPPRLVIQLNILAASGVLLLMPTTISAVFWPKRFSALVPFMSILFGVVTFFVLFYLNGANGFYGWNSGVIAMLVSTIIFVVAAYIESKYKPKCSYIQKF